MQFGVGGGGVGTREGGRIKVDYDTITSKSDSLLQQYVKGHTVL